MHSHVGGQSDTADEEEKGVESVQGEHGQWDGHAFDDGRSNEVEQGQHGEDGDKHDVVDDGVVAGESLGDHVAGQGQDEEGQEELSTESESQLVRAGRQRRELEGRQTWRPRRPSCTICMLKVVAEGSDVRGGCDVCKVRERKIDEVREVLGSKRTVRFGQSQRCLGGDDRIK